jgi:hypothetical protein
MKITILKYLKTLASKVNFSKTHKNRLFLSLWQSTQSYCAGEIVYDRNNNYYLSLNENNTQSLTNLSAWLPISPRRVIGTITYSDLLFTAIASPPGLMSGTYSIHECGDILLLNIKLFFIGPSTEVTAIRISDTKSYEIHNAFLVAYGIRCQEDDIFGHGYVNDVSTIQRANIVYSPMRGYIEAQFTPINYLQKVNIHIFMFRR